MDFRICRFWRFYYSENILVNMIIAKLGLRPCKKWAGDILLFLKPQVRFSWSIYFVDHSLVTWPFIFENSEGLFQYHMMDHMESSRIYNWLIWEYFGCLTFPGFNSMVLKYLILIFNLKCFRQILYPIRISKKSAHVTACVTWLKVHLPK